MNRSERRAGAVAVAPPSSVMKSRRLMSDMTCLLLPRSEHWQQRVRTVSLPHIQLAAEGAGAARHAGPRGAAARASACAVETGPGITADVKPLRSRAAGSRIQ